MVIVAYDANYTLTDIAAVMKTTISNTFADATVVYLIFIFLVMLALYVVIKRAME